MTKQLGLAWVGRVLYRLPGHSNFAVIRIIKETKCIEDDING